MLENGATTLWEHWDFSDNTYSHNHPMFGSVSEWFYKWLAGIQADPAAIGFDKITIRPQITSDVNWVKASYNSIHGKITSEWKREKMILQFRYYDSCKFNRNSLSPCWGYFGNKGRGS